MARFHQNQGWQGTEMKLLQTILVITKTSVQLAVLEVVLCPGLIAQLVEAVASWDHAVCLQSLSLTIYNATFQSLDPQNTPLLAIIWTAFPSLVELVIKDEVPIQKDIMSLASSNRLKILRLQSFTLHLPCMAHQLERSMVGPPFTPSSQRLY